MRKEDTEFWTSRSRESQPVITNGKKAFEIEKFSKEIVWNNGTFTR